MTPDEPLVIAYPHETMNGVRIDAAVLPTADAPTAEMVEKALQALRESAERYGWTAFSDVEKGYYGRSLAWLSSRLPSLLTADADRQRIEWQGGDAVRTLIDAERFPDRVPGAARSPEGAPND